MNAFPSQSPLKIEELKELFYQLDERLFSFIIFKLINGLYCTVTVCLLTISHNSFIAFKADITKQLLTEEKQVNTHAYITVSLVKILHKLLFSDLIIIIYYY